MAVPGTKPAEGRKRGEIETLPSGALRVKVYAGIDPLTGKRHYLTEVIPAGPTAHKEARAARTRLINQVDEQRNPRTKATVNQLMDRYLELLDVDLTTRKGYEGYIRNHVRPLLGDLQVGKLDDETLDSFYTILRRCRAHCDGRPFIQHADAAEHELPPSARTPDLRWPRPPGRMSRCLLPTLLSSVVARSRWPVKGTNRSLRWRRS